MTASLFMFNPNVRVQFSQESGEELQHSSPLSSLPFYSEAGNVWELCVPTYVCVYVVSAVDVSSLLL